MRLLNVPPEIEAEIQAGATLALSVSGGKDSQALVAAVMHWMKLKGYTNDAFCIHADLGSVEWPQTAGHCQKIADDHGLRLVTVAYPGGLMARWKKRLRQLLGLNKPFWSSSTNRYCTSDTKRDEINKELRKYTHIISVEGIRWQEGKVSKTGNRTGRAAKPFWEVRNRIWSLGRRAFTWNAIIDFTIEDVWGTHEQDLLSLEAARMHYRTFGKVPEWWPFHPAYAFGNNRLSCMICILGDDNDINNGIRHNPELAREMADMEAESGFDFREDLSIRERIQELSA
jgi:3'-phosphoadenosine 5'-phosphosulfate sulfotransferase (PAPS reductase)/FAD synthetase